MSPVLQLTVQVLFGVKSESLHFHTSGCYCTGLSPFLNGPDRKTAKMMTFWRWATARRDGRAHHPGGDLQIPQTVDARDTMEGWVAVAPFADIFSVQLQKYLITDGDIFKHSSYNTNFLDVMSLLQNWYLWLIVWSFPINRTISRSTDAMGMTRLNCFFSKEIELRGNLWKITLLFNWLKKVWAAV